MQQLEVVPTYLNPPQQKVDLARANKTVVVAGRRLGKTTRILAMKIHRLIHSMPRATFNLYCSTYQQFLTQTGKELFYGLHEIGYREGLHYVFGKDSPFKTKPYRNPIKPQYTIYFYTGAVLQVLSEDVFSNGGTAQGILGDEARKFNQQKFNEVYLSMSDDKYFKGNPDYLSLTLTTDQPQTPVETWIFDYEKKMVPSHVLASQKAQQLMDSWLLESLTTKDDKRREYLARKINKLSKEVAPIRNELTYFLEASTLENVYALGIRYFENLMEVLPPAHFRRSVLNHRLRNMETAFFPTFDRNKHTYSDFDYDYLTYDRANSGLYLPTSLQDNDIIKTKGFHVSIDSGGSINLVVVGQHQGSIFRVVNAIHVDPPSGLKEVAKKFDSYYHTHQRKEVTFMYDSTQNAENFMHIKAYIEFGDALRALEWIVYNDYYPDTIFYEPRYLFFHNLFRGGYKGMVPEILIHREHCDNLVIGLENAQIYPTDKDPYHLDKRLEKKKGVDQSKTTHFPEAFVCLIFNLFSKKVGNKGYYGIASG